MVKKGNGKDKSNGSREGIFSGLQDGTKLTIFAVISFLLAVFFVIAAFKGGGVAGRLIFSGLKNLFGIGYVFLPIICVLAGISFIGEYRPKISISQLVSVIIFLFSALAI